MKKYQIVPLALALVAMLPRVSICQGEFPPCAVRLLCFWVCEILANADNRQGDMHEHVGWYKLCGERGREMPLQQ